MKPGYIKKAAAREKQKATVLINNPNFQNDVSGIRSKWRIPAGGLKTEEQNQDWYYWLQEETDNYFNKEWPKHREELNNLKKQRKFREQEVRQREINDNAPLNAFGIAVTLLVKKYRMSPKWKHPLERYIMFNNVSLMNIPVGVIVETKYGIGREMDEILVRIEDQTTIEDIKAVWPTVKHFQNRLSYKKQKKYQPIKNFDRDKRAFELHFEGKTLNETAKTISEEFNHTYTYSDVSPMIRRYKKRIGINQA